MNSILIKLMIIGFGGFVGSVLRYLISGFAQRISNTITFPIGTLAVNLFGCLIFSLLIQFAESHGLFINELNMFVFVGVLGGFTTFSTFSNESVNLMRAGENTFALLSLGAHIILGFGSIWLGRLIATIIWR